MSIDYGGWLLGFDGCGSEILVVVDSSGGGGGLWLRFFY